MFYDSIIVHLEIDDGSDTRLQYATDLAGDLDAFLVGFTAAAVRPVHASEFGVPADDAYSEELVEMNRARFREMKTAFLSTAGDGHNSGWRDSEDLPTRALIGNARMADLIVAGTPGGAWSEDVYRHVDPGELVCNAGRPVLFVARDAVYRHPECALVGWKDTPQARRAVTFALPFLKLANKTLVVTMREGNNDDDGGAADVMRYLVRHGIDADCEILPGRRDPEDFIAAIRARKADLVVTGAYSHSRLREKIFGGFTQALLMQTDLNRLMAG